MRKKLSLTLMLMLLCITASRAAFAPESGKQYALKVVNQDLYLDIQTLGIKDQNAETDNLSLNTTPCIIYFELSDATTNSWYIKNVNGNYATANRYNATIGSTNPYSWFINETTAGSGKYTISHNFNNSIKYINDEADGTSNFGYGKPLYCNKTNGIPFELVEYTAPPAIYAKAALVSPTDTYFSFTASGTTAASFQEQKTFFIVNESNGTYSFQSDEAKYIGLNGNWNVAATTNAAWWNISTPDEDGFVTISKSTNNNHRLGSDRNTNAGTGIYTDVGTNCNKWKFLSTYDCATAGTQNGGKYHFTSEKIHYLGKANTIRFTLTESGAYYKNGAKRLSFDSFVLYDADGNKVELTKDNFTGNNIANFANMTDGTNSTYSYATWDSSNATDDYFEIELGNIDLGGAFSFSFVTENTTMNAKRFTIDLSQVEKIVDEKQYQVYINAPDGKTVTVTYNGNEISTGEYITNNFDTWLFDATDIAGYTWSVEVDRENMTVTIVYTQLVAEENPAAVVALINRIGGKGASEQFKFVHDPTLNLDAEQFVIGSEDGKILIKGSSLSALTTGIGWYLQNHAKINIAWNSLNEKAEGDAYADLSSLPVPSGEEIHTSDAKYRYYLNYCTFGYSMTTWTWKRWQQEIDWMALHGINMPLQIVGLEEVWRKFLTIEKNGIRKYGYSDSEAKAFVAGPAFTAWWAMNNLEGWGGTADGTKSGGTWAGAGGVQDDAWYARQKQLAGDIVARQRELGMQPVLPGFSGMVPSNFASKSGYATRGNGGNWAGDFVRPLILSVSNANYDEIAADYYACLKEVMGESNYYSMDPFHEGGGAGTTEDYKALYDAMYHASPNSQWVIQQWQWSPTQKLSLYAVPAGRLIVLDLFSDGKPAFDSYNGYAPQDAVFCAIPNFGGRSGLMGRLNNVTDNYFKFKGKYTTIKGIGAAPEAIEQTPVAYDLIFQLPWMNGKKPDVAAWIKQYATSRYGADNAIAQEAWELLRQGPLNYGADAIQGPVEDVWAARPNLTAAPASAWGKTINNAIGTYTKARHQMLIDATYKLLSQNDALNLASGSIYESNYNYDIVEFSGAVLADYAYYLLLGIGEAKSAAGNNFENDARYKARRDAFLALIAYVDELKGTNLNFRLGKWTQEARDAAAEVEGATTATPDWYEFNNARTLITTWSSPNTNLNDYSYRSWQGLMKDVYLPRWQYYFDNDCQGNINYGYFEWNWAHGLTHEVGETAVSTTKLKEGDAGYSYSRDPEGNTVETANKVLAKYIIPIALADGSTYYAYRCLNNDLSLICTIVAAAGTTIDLTQYFGTLDNATITGDIFSGVPVMNNAVIKSDATNGSHSASIVMEDGTTLTFAVVINPPFNGVYKITHQNQGDVFIGYNTDHDNNNNEGYKLITPVKYSATGEADKLFTITPSGAGYTISAQGKYAKAVITSGWNHIMLSDEKGDAGVYLFNETSIKDLFTISCTSGTNKYFAVYDGSLGVIGNDVGGKANSFKLTKVTHYTLAVPESGITTLCLPFNVTLPKGVTAYDVNEVINTGGDRYACTLSKMAAEGETIMAGTPAIIKANEGNYNLEITMSAAGAKTSQDGSLLRGNYFSGTIDAGAGKYKLDGNQFSPISEAVAANSCYLETSISASNILIDEAHYTQTISAAKYSTLMLGFDAVIPENVGAFTVSSIADNNEIILTNVENCLPANTPVILYSDVEAATSYVFYNGDASSVSVGENMLRGSLTRTAVKCDDDYRYYQLMNSDSGVKMYWMYKEYDDNGNYVGDDKGTHIICPANRAYLPIPVSKANNITSFSFRFDDSTTGIDSCIDETTDEVIHDINGRRLLDITQPGIYIINNKKIIIK